MGLVMFAQDVENIFRGASRLSDGFCSIENNPKLKFRVFTLV